MANLSKIVLLMLLLAPITFCEAKGWFTWLYGDDTDAEPKKRLSVIPGLLKEQIETMKEKLHTLPEDSSERQILLFKIDQRIRQMYNLKLISRGMSVKEFDEFVKLDDELASIRMGLRPKATRHNEAELMRDPAMKRMLQLSAQLDAVREKHGVSTVKGRQDPEVDHLRYQRHMSEEVKTVVNDLRKRISVATERDEVSSLREQLHDLYTRSINRKKPTPEELSVVDKETAELKQELVEVNRNLVDAHDREDDDVIHKGRVRMRDINAILERSLLQRVLVLRKERDIKLMNDRIREQGPPS